MNETMVFALGIAAIGFIAIYALSAALNFVVALKSVPNRRATWTVGIAYVAASIAAVCGIIAISHDISSPDTPFPIDAFVAPLLLAPGAIVIFLLRRWEYRAAWLDDPENLPEGVELANDDWRFGAIALLLVVGALAGRVVLRLYLRS